MNSTFLYIITFFCLVCNFFHDVVNFYLYFFKGAKVSIFIGIQTPYSWLSEESINEKKSYYKFFVSHFWNFRKMSYISATIHTNIFFNECRIFSFIYFYVSEDCKNTFWIMKLINLDDFVSHIFFTTSWNKHLIPYLCFEVSCM